MAGKKSNVVSAGTKAIVDQVIGFLEAIAAITVTKFDDTAVKLLKFIRDDPAFQAWMDKITPAQKGAPLVQSLLAAQAETRAAAKDPDLRKLFDGFRKREAEAGTPVSGSFGELISLIFQAIAWFKARQGKKATPTS